MMRTGAGVLFSIAATFAITALAASPARAQEPKRLPQGDDPKQFVLVGIGPESVTIKDGEIRVSGKPDGYFATRESYKNYTLRFEWMYERPDGLTDDAKFRGNSGLLLHIAEPHKIWPKCIESQLMNADAGNLFGVSGATFRGSKNAEAQKKAIKPIGEWNLQEVTCKDGSIVCTINGVEVSRGDGAAPDSGPFALQSEGAPIRFRKISIQTLD